jgi:DNA-3-methyladenine glycosylase II
MKPDYWDGAKRSLARRDAVMAAIIRSRPRVHLVRRGEPFMTLARAIVGQQISVKAAQSVWDRLMRACEACTPQAVLRRRAAASRLRPLGPQDRVHRGPRAALRRGLVHPQRWPQMSDEEVIADLVQVRGIGRWTAEMFLIFNLLRPDVFPLDDLGLQNALRRHYFGGRKASPRACGAWARNGALALGGHLVPVAVPRPGASRILSP